MEDAMTAFVFFAVLGAVCMAMLTRSLGGALLGLTIVCIATAMLLMSQGGLWNTAVGVVLIVGGFFCMLLAFGLGLNFSHSALHGYDPQGRPFTASQNVFGEGATHAQSRWSSPEFHQPQIGSGDYSKLGDGK